MPGRVVSPDGYGAAVRTAGGRVDVVVVGVDVDAVLGGGALPTAGGDVVVPIAGTLVVFRLPGSFLGAPEPSSVASATTTKRRKIVKRFMLKIGSENTETDNFHNLYMLVHCLVITICSIGAINILTSTACLHPNSGTSKTS